VLLAAVHPDEPLQQQLVLVRFVHEQILDRINSNGAGISPGRRKDLEDFYRMNGIQYKARSAKVS
jgi:hypothetical protein